MDRRTLLALVLSTLVLVVWTHFFGPKPTPQAPVPGSPATTTTTNEPTISETAPPATPESVVPQPEPDFGAVVASSWDPAPARTLTITTDLTTTSISSIGGTLTSLTLHEFENGADRSRLVDLVREGFQALDCRLIWRDPVTTRVSEEVSLAQVPFRVVEETATTIRLSARRTDGLVVERAYTFTDSTYVFDHQVAVREVGRTGAPDFVVVGWRSGIPFTERADSVDKNFLSGLAMVGNELREFKPDKFKKSDVQLVEGNVRWLGVRNKYFSALLIPEPGTAQTVYADGNPESHLNTMAVGVPISSATGASMSMRVYAGPSDLERLAALGDELDKAVRLGWTAIRPVARFLLTILHGVHKVVPNYGWAIIVLTVLIRLVLHPLNRASMKSMKAMQTIQPKVKALQEKHKGDPQEMNKQVMGLYKEAGVNPLGGCLPMVLQMPLLFALYQALMFSVDLRLEPWMWWVNDLSSPDIIGRVMGFEIHILPLVMTAVSVLQSRATPKDPRQAALTTMMPLMFMFFFYNMPSGLVLYWTVMTLMGWIQQISMNRGDDKVVAAAPGVGAVAVDVEEIEDSGSTNGSPDENDKPKEALTAGAGRGRRGRRKKK